MNVAIERMTEAGHEVHGLIVGLNDMLCSALPMSPTNATAFRSTDRPTVKCWSLTCASSRAG